MDTNGKDPKTDIQHLLETAEAMRNQLLDMGRLLKLRDNQIAIAVDALIGIGTDGDWKSQQIARRAIDTMRKTLDRPKEKSNNE